MAKKTITIDQLIELFRKLHITKVQLVSYTHKNKAQTSATEKPVITRSKGKKKLCDVKKSLPVISKRPKKLRFGKENIINEGTARNLFRIRFEAYCKNIVGECSTDNSLSLNSSNVQNVLPSNGNLDTPADVNTNSGCNTRTIDRSRLDTVRRNLLLEFADEPSCSGTSAVDDTRPFTYRRDTEGFVPNSDYRKRRRSQDYDSSDSD